MSDRNMVEKFEYFKVETIHTFRRIAFSQKVTLENIESRYFPSLVETYLIMLIENWDLIEFRMYVQSKRKIYNGNLLCCWNHWTA